MENKKLISYSLITSLLVVFGFYSSTIMYAEAVTLSNFTITAFDLRGSSYNSANNSWYFASPNNNTLARIVDNTTTPTFLPVNGNSNCVDPINVESLEFSNDAYIAIWCDNGAVATHGLMIRDRVTNEEKDFENNIFNTEDGFIIVEWDLGNKVYVINHGSTSQQIAIFDETKINSTTASMFTGLLNLSAQCALIFDAVVNEADSLMYISCQRITTNVMTIAVLDLQGSVVTQYITLSGTSATGNIDYNTETEQIVYTAYDNNDLFLVDATDSSVDYTNTAICTSGLPLSPQYNENTNQIYFICNNTATGANTIQLFDVESQTSIANFPAGSSPLGVQGGTHYWTLMSWVDSKSALYGTFGWTQNTGSGAVANTITRIFDSTNAPSEDPNAEFCADPANANILICRLEDNPPLTGTATLFNQSSTNIVCQIGLLSCTQDEDGNFVPDNPDIQTNGVGYLILAIALGVFVSIMFIASGGKLQDIPTFVWFLGTIAIVGGLTAFEYINPTILVISIIIVIAMATAKAKGIFSDSELFRGER